MRWLDLPEEDRKAVCDLLGSFSASKESEIQRWNRHPKAHELREWINSQATLVRALRVACSTLSNAKRRPRR